VIYTGAGKLGFSFVRITALMLTKDRMWVGTGNGVVLSIPLVAAQPESSRSVVTTPTDNGGPGGVVRVYTDTMEKGGEKSGVSSFMPYCSMVSLFRLIKPEYDALSVFCLIYSVLKV
jgi:hypothetical protein